MQADSEERNAGAPWYLRQGNEILWSIIPNVKNGWAAQFPLASKKLGYFQFFQGIMEISFSMRIL